MCFLESQEVLNYSVSPAEHIDDEVSLTRKEFIALARQQLDIDLDDGNEVRGHEIVTLKNPMRTGGTQSVTLCGSCVHQSCNIFYSNLGWVNAGFVDIFGQCVLTNIGAGCCSY